MRVIGPREVQLGLKKFEWLTQSDDCEAEVLFVNNEYDYRQNWMARNSVTN